MFSPYVYAFILLFIQECSVQGDILSHSGWRFLGQYDDTQNPQCGAGYYTPGRISKRIIASTEARHKEFPWMVEFFKILKRSGGEKIIVPYCGGTLISNFHVLTDATSMYKKFKQNDTGKYKYKYAPIHHFTAGAYRISDTYFDELPVDMYARERDDYFVKEVELHPEYLKNVQNSNSMLYSVAIVIPTETILVRPFDIYPVCLPRVPPLQNGNEFTAVGFGATQIVPEVKKPRTLMKFNVTALSQMECQEKFKKIVRLTDERICSYTNPEGGICPADGGSGLFRVEPYGKKGIVNRYFVYGVAVPSAGAHCKPYSSFQNVYKHLEFILDNMEKHPPSPIV